MVTLFLSNEFYEWNCVVDNDPVFSFRLKKGAHPKVEEEYKAAEKNFRHLYE